MDSIQTMMTKLQAVASRATTDTKSNLEIIANQGGYGTAFEYGSNLATTGKWRVDNAKAVYMRSGKTPADKRAFVNRLIAQGVSKTIVDKIRSSIGA